MEATPFCGPEKSAGPLAGGQPVSPRLHWASPSVSDLQQCCHVSRNKSADLWSLVNILAGRQPSGTIVMFQQQLCAGCSVALRGAVSASATQQSGWFDAACSWFVWKASNTAAH
jgi:hypothetical protein